MTYQVIKDIEVETPEGKKPLKSGQVIRLTKDDAIPLIEAGLILPAGRIACKVYSNILQAYLWVVETDQDMHSLRTQEISGAIYTGQDIEQLKRLPKEALRAIHAAKEIFPLATIEQVNNNKQNAEDI